MTSTFGVSLRAGQRPPPAVCVCGRVIARYPHPASAKARVRHKCPHGVWCIAGRTGKNAHGFNHNTYCKECCTR